MSLTHGTINLASVEREFYKTLPTSAASDAFKDWVLDLDESHRQVVMREIQSIHDSLPCNTGMGIAAITELLAVYLAIKEGWIK